MQEAGFCMALPCGQRYPASHALHAVAPSAPWYLPSSQLLQAAWRPLAANVPGVHGTGLVAPMPHAAPAGQAWQLSTELRPVWLPNRPDGQGRAAGEPSGQ